MRGFRRTAVLAATALLLIVAGQPARGQSAPDAAAPLPTGTASATAVVARLTPGVGSLNLGLATGVAISNATNSIAQAQSEALDLGLIGALLQALDLLDGEQVPKPLRIDNRGGDASAQEDEYPLQGATLGGGRMQVRATTAPMATAAATVASSFGPLVSIDAGRAESTSRIIPGEGREARASVSLDLDIAGVVQLSGLRWEAVHRTGDAPRSEGTFSVASATLGGVPLPVESLSGVNALVNTVLAPAGLHVDLPRVERPGDRGDVVRITPLRVMLKDTPLGKAVLGPILNLTREERLGLYANIAELYSGLDAALLAVDVGVSILAGDGFLSVEVGGAEASSSELVLEDVSGEIGSEVGEGAARIPSGGAPIPPLGASSSGAAVADRRISGPGAIPLEDRCVSTHPFKPLGCADGSLLPIGLAGIAVTAGVLALDLRHQRRLRAALSDPVGGSGRVVWGSVSAPRLARSYAPVLGAAIAFVVLATAVTVPRDRLAYSGPLEIPNLAAGSGAGDASAGEVAGGSGGSGEPAYGSAAGAGAGAPAGGAGRVGGCSGRTVQVPGDPYSPPCYSFSGANGGVTSMGVTDDTITVSVREVEGGSATDIFRGIAGQSFQDSSESVANTQIALAEYFSSRFQFYGRKLKLEFFRGEGNGINELLGGGKEKALADSVVAAQEIHAFADISSITLPYADGLARHGVVNFGAPYPSRAWFEARRPYSWSIFPDGTNIVEATSSAMLGRYPPGSRAEHAGGSVHDRPRTFAIVAPENAEYQESMNILISILRNAGIEVALNMKYKLDLTTMPNQASNIHAQLKDAGVTSIFCMCDPAMLAFGMTPKANEQDYHPEWITAGLVFVDQDVVAQSMETRQWAHAFGTAYNAESERFGASFPYYAYKSVRPNDEPAYGVEELYYEMYMLAIGIQMAGPDLTPESFEAGMFAYPGGFGPRGTWDFGPGDRTPANDYREIWWDPARTSEQNDKPGAWVELNGGQRYSPASPPSGRAPFFEQR